MKTQICSKCGIDKPLVDFYSNHRHKAAPCKLCYNAQIAPYADTPIRGANVTLNPNRMEAYRVDAANCQRVKMTKLLRNRGKSK